MLMTTKKLARFIGWDRKKFADDLATGHLGFVPPASASLRFWNLDDAASALFYVDLIGDGYPVRLAGTLATRLREAMRAHPEEERLTLVRLDNGSHFAAPTDALDVTSGWSSGAMVRTATAVDVRNLRARIEREIEAEARIVGDADD